MKFDCKASPLLNWNTTLLESSLHFISKICCSLFRCKVTLVTPHLQGAVCQAVNYKNILFVERGNWSAYATTLKRTTRKPNQYYLQTPYDIQWSFQHLSVQGLTFYNCVGGGRWFKTEENAECKLKIIFHFLLPPLPLPSSQSHNQPSFYKSTSGYTKSKLFWLRVMGLKESNYNSLKFDIILGGKIVCQTFMLFWISQYQ